MRRALLLLSLVATAVGGLIAGGDPSTPTTLVVGEGAATSAAEVTEPPSTTVAPTTTTEAPTATTLAVDVAPAAEELVPEETTTTTTRPRAVAHAPAYSSLEPCGGDLPPCEVKWRESGGNYRAINWSGCGGRGCFGAWQFDPRTWAGMGYAGRPDQADPEVQDEAARRLWDNGKGCRAWSGPNWNGCMFLES